MNPNEQESYPLDDAAIGLVLELQTQIMALSARVEGVLSLFVRQHALSGDWKLSPNGKELIRVVRSVGKELE